MAESRRRAAGRDRTAWGDEGPVELTNPARGALEVEDDGTGQDEAQIVWDDEPAVPSPRSGVPASAQVAPEDLAAEEIDAARRAESAAADRTGRRPVAPGAEAAPSRADGRGRTDAAPTPGQAANRPAGRVRPDRAAPGPDRAWRRHRPLSSRPRARGGPRIGMIFFLLTLLIAATVGWRVWMNRRAQFPLIIERGRTEGIPALDEGDFEGANQLLSAARSAVNALGGAVADADEIRQAAKEAAIFVNLCPKSLEELLGEAQRSTDPETWRSTFDSLYKGRSYLFETQIEATPEDGGSYEIAYRVFPPGEASRFGDGGISPRDPSARVDVSGLEAFEQAGLKLGARVPFGANLQAIVYDAERKEWVVRLEPKSAVFITHRRALLTIGWKEPETVDLPQEDQP